VTVLRDGLETQSCHSPSVFSASSWMIYIIHDPNNCPSPCLGAYGQLLPRGGMRCRAACAHPCSALPTCFCSSPPLPGCRHPLFPDRVDDPSLSIVLPHSVFHTRWQILRQLKRGLSFPPNVVRYCPLSGSVQLADFAVFSAVYGLTSRSQRSWHLRHQPPIQGTLAGLALGRSGPGWFRRR